MDAGARGTLRKRRGRTVRVHLLEASPDIS
jgi:hypothetical protein